MKDFFGGITDSYNSLAGTSKIVPVAALLITAVILLYNDDENNERRRIHPAVFLLSVYSGISYVIVCVYRKSKSLLVLLFSGVIICMIGEFVFSARALKRSIYTNGEFYEIVFAVIAILVYMLIHGLIACRLFKDGEGIARDRIIFIVSVVLLSLFGFYSEGLALSTMLLSPLSGSSVVLYGVLPLLLWIYLVYEDKINVVFGKIFAEDADEEDDELFEEGWDMKKHKILNIRNMAIAVAVIVVCFAGAVLVLNNKINSLHEATALLNAAASDKASIYEVKNGDEIAASIIVSSDGNVTVTGGGNASNGTVLFDEISKRTEVVSRWYLFGDGDENKAAYDFCKDNGITVMNTYVLEGLKELE